MRAKEFLNEDVPAARTDTEREVAQAIYMEGRCGVLAIAINQANPERYKLGYIYEYNVPGTQDVYLDPDEFDALDPEEQQQVKLETQSWALVHAYVVDQQTKEYIDARGRHSKVPDLNYELNLTRKNVFPATSKDIVDITVDMKWNDATEEWDMVKGIAAWNQLGLDNDIPKALDYAVKYLNIDLSKRSQSTPKKPVWMNPGDPLPPSSPTGTWVILGPYKNVLYRFSAPNEQRARSMKDQWCKENNIDPDSNRFCRLKYDGEVRLGQPIKPRGAPVVENTNQAAVDALMKKHGWSMGRTANGDLAFTWQGSKYEFFGERVRITLPDGKSISVVWNKKPDWQGRGNDELSFAQAVQNKYLTFDLPIWQALNRGQLTDSQAIQKFKAENERQAREAVAQGQLGVVEVKSHDFMAGHCHVMAMALKQLHPDWQIRAHVGYDDDEADDTEYRVDHVYTVAPDGTAYDCRGRFDNEQQLVGPDTTGGIDTQYVNFGPEEIKQAILRGELKRFTKQDLDNAMQVGKQVVAEGSLTEIENFKQSDFRGGKDSLDRYSTPGKKHLRALPGGSDLMYSITSTVDGTDVHIVDPGIPGITKPSIVAGLSLYQGVIPDSVQVGSITVDEDYRGRGLAKALYGIVLTIMKKTLISGSSQTPGGRRNWLSLASIPGVEIKGLLDLYNFQLEKVIDQLMQLGGQFVARDNDHTYWAFDVVPGNGQLAPAVKNKLSKLYGYDSDNLLMATWTGGKQVVAEDLTEVVDLDTAFPLKWDQQFAAQGEIHAAATDADGREIGISFTPAGNGEITDVAFTRGGTHEMTGRGDAGRVMATVIKAINIYANKYKPPYLAFSAKSSGGRSSAYTAMIRRYAQKYELLPTDQYPAALNNYLEFIGSDQPFVLART